MAHVSRPDFVYIGNHTYSIEWISNDDWQNLHLGPDDDACTYAARQTIYIRLSPGARESHYHELVLHEITHAVWDSTMLTHVKMTEPEDPEEFIIGVQTPALLFALRMSPDVTKWLMSDPTVVR